MRVRTGAVLGVALAALAISVASASGAATRAEYVAQADPICKQANRQSKQAAKKHIGALNKIGKQAPDEGPVSKAERKRFLRRFSRALAGVLAPQNKITGQTIGRLSFVTPPPGDEAAVGYWLQGLHQFKLQVDQAIRGFRRANLKRGLNNLVKADNTLTAAQRPLSDWGFRQCVDSKAQAARTVSRITRAD
jgi:hypothetical protein